MNLDDMEYRSKRGKKVRAGLVPYFVEENGDVRYLVRIPSNFRYGGPDWQIAKGEVEPDEDPIESAIREAGEELGIRTYNLAGRPVKLGSWGDTTVYIAPTKNMNQLAAHDYETGRVGWLTNEEFKKAGRRIHQPMIAKADEIIKNGNNR